MNGVYYHLYGTLSIFFDPPLYYQLHAYKLYEHKLLLALNCNIMVVPLLAVQVCSSLQSQNESIVQIGNVFLHMQNCPSSHLEY